MVEPFLSMSKMSSRESAMTFFGALPKPLNFDQKPLSENRSIVTKTPDTERNTDANSKIGQKWLENMNLNINFVNYDATLENLDLVYRDISQPFEFLNFFAKLKSKDENFNETRKVDDGFILATKAKLVEIKLQVLNKAEKFQSLSNIPELMVKPLIDIDYGTFLEIFSTLLDVFWTWIDSVRKIRRRRIVRKFYATSQQKVFKIKSLTTVLEKIFFEGFSSLNYPNLMDLSYTQFELFLTKFSISYCGPFETNFNGQKLVAIFVSARFNSLRFFNHNSPLFGIFEFEAVPDRKFEKLPKWFLDPPTVNNYAIDKMISDFERMSFV